MKNKVEHIEKSVHVAREQEKTTSKNENACCS